MKKILVVFGTRPEAVKMCPLVKELLRRGMDARVLVTGQHREMLSSVLDFFGVEPHYDLDIMEEGQTLFDITERVLRGVERVLCQEDFSLVLVHGDTTTAFAAALAAFYKKIPVGHVEAGLRTYNKYSPYPEEFNRTAIDAISDYCFAPTDKAAEALFAEGKKSGVYVTGNTVIDSLSYTVKDDFRHEILDFADGRRILLLTAHRRENIGSAMAQMFEGVKLALAEHPELCAVYPMHPNPEVRRAALSAFADVPGVRLCEPLDVFDFHNILSRSHIAVTDSGGVQEEAPHFGVPVLIMRDTTEREEGLLSGGARLIGRSAESVYRGICGALAEDTYRAMSQAENPYGDGRACVRIADIIDDMS